MFNTTIIQQKGKEYIPYEKTVIEKKAPTDESIKLLNEFKEEALKDTMLVFTLKNTSFEAAFRYVEFSQTMEKKAIVTFTVNEKNIIKEIKIDDTLSSAAQQGEIIEYLTKKWKQIVQEVILEETADVAINFISQNNK